MPAVLHGGHGAAARPGLHSALHITVVPGGVVVSWQFLIVGSFGAVGAALAVGTLAALVRYHRTGRFPDQENAPVTRGRLVGLWLRVIVGTVLAVAAFVSLAQEGLL